MNSDTGEVSVVQPGNTVTITVTGEKTGISTTCQVTTKGPATVVTGNQLQTNPGNYIGKEVVNYASGNVTSDNKTSEKLWRIFYIDKEGKYSLNGERNVVYIKAEELGDYVTASTSYTNSTLMSIMNPKWDEGNTLTEDNWTNGMKISAWFLDPTKWTQYANSNAKFALGAHSFEMYLDALNQSRCLYKFNW